MRRLVFLDTEFSGLDQHDPYLISLALVREDGDDALYVELAQETWRHAANYWTLENVVPLLRGGDAIVSAEGIRDRVTGWLDRQGMVQVVSDYPEYDFAFMKAIMRPWHDGLHPDPIKFGAGSLGESHRTSLERVRASCFSPERPEHNALSDAFALRCMWQAAKELAPEAMPCATEILRG